MPGTAVTKSVVANDPSGKKREEVFVDIIEKISVTFNASVSTALKVLSVKFLCDITVCLHELLQLLIKAISSIIQWR